MERLRSFAALAAALFLLSCGQGRKPLSQLDSQPLSADEKLLDLDVAFSHFKKYYAPLQYKEKTLGVKYDDVFAQLRAEAAASTTDQEFFDVLGKLVDSFKDGHVSVSIPGMARYSLPFSLDYFDGHYVVVDVKSDFSAETGVVKGDELTKIDGRSPSEIASKILEFRSFGYDRADQRFAAYQLTHRSHVVPTSNQAYLDFKRASDGAQYNIMAFWKKESGIAAESSGAHFRSEITDASILLFGENTPFFYTDKARTAFNFVKVGVTEEQWHDAGEEGKPFDLFALLYRHEGKNVLLIRIPTYSINDADLKRNVRTYELLLKSYSNLADVLVIDQTHNPGGSVEYVEELARLFMKRPGPSFAFAPRADRLWLRFVDKILTTPELPTTTRQYFNNVYREIDAANERSDFLAPQIALTRTTNTIVENTAWTKPVLLLIDELCGSGGDGFPMIMKGNDAAKLFGHRTAGMGGNVDSVPALPNTGATFQLTRSLFYLATSDGSLPDTAIIENNGVTPHIERSYGYADFQDGFAKYVKHFSDAAIGLGQ